MYIHIVSNQVNQTYELIYKLDRSGKQCSTLCTAAAGPNVDTVYVLYIQKYSILIINKFKFRLSVLS